MIQEAYCSFEVARLLEEKGFEGDINAYYHILDNGNKVCSVQEFSNSEAPHLYIPAPTHQMAMAWLREVHNINIDIVPIWNRNRWEYQIFIVTPATSQRPYVANTLYLDYEEAVEAALKYVLENLI